MPDASQSHSDDAVSTLGELLAMLHLEPPNIPSRAGVKEQDFVVIDAEEITQLLAHEDSQAMLNSLDSALVRSSLSLYPCLTDTFMQLTAILTILVASLQLTDAQQHAAMLRLLTYLVNDMHLNAHQTPPAAPPAIVQQLSVSTWNRPRRPPQLSSRI